jgi:UDP-N-acetylmuramoyl-tripeptide--D-alanyl-D-alanine ligase
MGYGRMLIEKIKNFTIINDCYNANPESMTVALNNLSAINGNKKIAVLADMRELGEATEIEHQNLLRLAIEKADIVFIYGNEMKKAFAIVQDKKINFIESKKDIAEILEDIIMDGDVVLVKGSRGLAMEELVNDLKI